MPIIFNLNTITQDKRQLAEIMSAYDKLQAISFVGSFKVIEEVILPQFKEVNLILGLEDARTADLLEEKLDFVDRSEKLVETSTEFLKRYLDKTLQLYFTKSRLIHTKLFILTNDKKEYAILAGSMNLTQKAMTTNHEYLSLKEGHTDDNYYKEHLKIFENCLKKDAVPYVDRKIIQNIYDRRSQEVKKEVVLEETATAIFDDMVEKLQSKQIVMQPQLVEEVKNTHMATGAGKIPIKDSAQSIVAQFFPDRVKNLTAKNMENAVRTIKGNILPTIIHKGKMVAEEKEGFTERSIADTFHEGVAQLRYDEENKLVLLNGLPLTPDPIKQSDVDALIKAIDAYSNLENVGGKSVDERTEALNALVHVFTAPLIWKIRREVQQFGIDKVAASKLVLGIFGSGGSGKSTLWKYVLGPSTNQVYGGVLDAANIITSSNGRFTRQSQEIILDYITSGLISPIYIDDMQEGTVNSKAFKDFVKTNLSNLDRDYPHGSIVFTSNLREITSDRAILRRSNYACIDSTLKDRREHIVPDMMAIGEKLTPTIYYNILVQLNDRLNHLTKEEAKGFLNDGSSNNYLWLTRELLQNIFAEFGYADHYDSSNWEDNAFLGDLPSDWTRILKADGFENVRMYMRSDTAYVDMNIFSKNMTSDSEKRKEIERFVDPLPSWTHKRARQGNIQNAALEIDIDTFDKFLGENILRDEYNRRFGHLTDLQSVAQQQAELTSQAFDQMRENSQHYAHLIQEQREQYRQELDDRESKHAEELEELRHLVMEIKEQNNQNKKKGFLGRLFGK